MLGQKKNLSLFLSLVSIVVFAGPLMAADNALLEAEKAKKLIKDLKVKLDNTTWAISLTESGKSGSPTKDTLNFFDKKVASDAMTKEGFNPSNFTLRLKGDNRIIWETMQTSEKHGVCFWRGDIMGKEIKEGTTMRGVLSWHVKEGVTRDYSYESEPMKKRAYGEPKPEAQPAPEPVTSPEPVVEAPLTEDAPAAAVPIEPVVAEPIIAPTAIPAMPAAAQAEIQPPPIKEEEMAAAESPKNEVAKPEEPKKKKRGLFW